MVRAGFEEPGEGVEGSCTTETPERLCLGKREGKKTEMEGMRRCRKEARSGNSSSSSGMLSLFLGFEHFAWRNTLSLQIWALLASVLRMKRWKISKSGSISGSAVEEIP